MKKIYLYLAFAIFGLVGLASCGIRGPLETAPPIFGPAREKYDADKAQKAEEEKQKAPPPKQ